MDSTDALVSENHGKRGNAREVAAYCFSNVALTRSHSSVNINTIWFQQLRIDCVKHSKWALEFGE
jgi:hypothetical protein